MAVSQEVVHLVSLLSYVAERNAESSRRTRFHSAPTESLLSLVQRLSERIRCSPSCYAIALVYMDRATHGRSDLPLTLNTVHRLFTTALLVANQFVDDKSECAVQFARVAHIGEVDMARMKTEFVFRLRFHLCVSDHDVLGYANKLVGRFSSQRFDMPDMWRGESPSPASWQTPHADVAVAVCAPHEPQPRVQAHPLAQPQAQAQPLAASGAKLVDTPAKPQSDPCVGKARAMEQGARAVSKRWITAPGRDAVLPLW